MFDIENADKTGDKSNNDSLCVTFSPCSNFEQVLVNGYDQVTVRKLLNEHVPIEVQIKITQLFNQDRARRLSVLDGK